MLPLKTELSLLYASLLNVYRAIGYISILEWTFCAYLATKTHGPNGTMGPKFTSTSMMESIVPSSIIVSAFEMMKIRWRSTLRVLEVKSKFAPLVIGLLLQHVNIAAILDQARLACKQIQVNEEAPVFWIKRTTTFTFLSELLIHVRYPVPIHVAHNDAPKKCEGSSWLVCVYVYCSLSTASKKDCENPPHSHTHTHMPTPGPCVAVGPLCSVKWVLSEIDGG